MKIEKNGDYKKVLWKALGLEDYFYFQNNYECLINGSTDQISRFKKEFANYYKLSRRTQKWKDGFFNIFKEAIKHKDELNDVQMFEYYLKLVKDKCDKHWTEISFVSKMLHTINPEVFPIYDSRVAKCLDIKQESNVNVYFQLVERYQELLNDEIIKHEKNDLLKILSLINFDNEKFADYKLLDILFYS